MYAVQCCHSSLLELEDQNCPFGRGMCWQFEDDLVQFWCGNMVKLAAMILSIGYLAHGWIWNQFYVIFSKCCFQIKLKLFVYTYPKILEAFGAGNQVEFLCFELIFMLFCYSLTPLNKNICMWT